MDNQSWFHLPAHHLLKNCLHPAQSVLLVSHVFKDIKSKHATADMTLPSKSVATGFDWMGPPGQWVWWQRGREKLFVLGDTLLGGTANELVLATGLCGGTIKITVGYLQHPMLRDRTSYNPSTSYNLRFHPSKVLVNVFSTVAAWNFTSCKSESYPIYVLWWPQKISINITGF